ncbi:DUF2382 domain-containing protein [Kamptonema formosum]|uniref:DUF2382 domain-containing protein n=1 Tax=Kamptonema formosum TaxID=331992 RepID=UPI00034D0351|nr:DUF2382 domain-containing protein [Oscillatoria sp. PCC 10802]
MSEEVSARRAEPLKQNARLAGHLDQLKSQLLNLVVRDERGEPVGTVKDLTVAPPGQLNLIVSQPDERAGFRQFILNSKLIQRIEYGTQSLFVNLTSEQIEDLPEYIPLPEEFAESEEHRRERETQLPAGSNLEPDFAERKEDAAHMEIRLLEERLVVDRSKQKIGEVIVRKEIETRMVEVPVRREKLIVEQISPQHKQLAEIDLGEAEVTGTQAGEIASPTPTVTGEFDSPESASRFLEAIAENRPHGCAKVRVELILANAELQETYRQLLQRHSHSSSPPPA